MANRGLIGNREHSVPVARTMYTTWAIKMVVCDSRVQMNLSHFHHHHHPESKRGEGTKTGSRRTADETLHGQTLAISRTSTHALGSLDKEA